MTLTDLAKKVPLAAPLNARRRAFEVEHRYRQLVRTYSDSSAQTFAELWDRGSLSSLRLSQLPRVLFCGTDELQDFGGFVQALEGVCELKLLRRANGEYGQSVDGIAWTENSAALGQVLDELGKDGWTPEILLMQSMGYRFDPADLEALKAKYGFIVINVGMDERLAYRVRREGAVELGISGLNSVVDLALVTVPEAVHWYRADGVPAKYFPLASSAEVYFPLPDVPKVYDVGFIGRAYGRRLSLVKSIRAAGLSFRAHGPGWETGVLPVEDNNEFYNSCRVVLGAANIGHSKKLMNPKLRDFEVPLTGVPYVTNYTPELADLFVADGEMVFYKSERDLIIRLKRLIDNPRQAARIGEAGYRKATSEHQYGDRFRVLFDRVLRGDLGAEFVRLEAP